MTFKAEMLFNESIIFGELLAYGLKKTLPGRKVSLPLVNHGRVLEIRMIDVSDNLNGTKNVFILKKFRV